MPVAIPRPPHASESGRKAPTWVGYNMPDAQALMRLLLRWRHGNYRPLIIKDKFLMVKPVTLRIYLYQAKCFIKENPGTFTQEIRDLCDKFAIRLREDGVYIIMPPRELLRNAVNTAITVSDAKKSDYSGRQLFVHWISSPHEQGEYVDIPGKFNEADHTFFMQMQEEYANIVHVEFSPENVRVVWHAKSTKDDGESPW